jgi:hypothetical protein
MKTNEKVSLGTAIPDRDTNEINQLHYQPDFGNCQEPVDPVIPELVGIAKRLEELQADHVLHWIRPDAYAGRNEVFMTEDTFFRAFSSAEYGPHDDNWDKYFTEIDGVKFFCLAERSK